MHKVKPASDRDLEDFRIVKIISDFDNHSKKYKLLSLTSGNT